MHCHSMKYCTIGTGSVRFIFGSVFKGISSEVVTTVRNDNKYRRVSLYEKLKF